MTFSVNHLARTPLHCRHGFTLVYVLIIWVALCGFVSLAVDWGRVQMAKTQLQTAADTAARAASAEFRNGVTAAQNAAVTWAGYNSVDGGAIVLDPNNDVIFGTWDPQTRTFTKLNGPARATANSLQVICRRTTARGTGLKLWFAGVVGANTCDVTASST